MFTMGQNTSVSSITPEVISSAKTPFPWHLPTVFWMIKQMVDVVQQHWRETFSEAGTPDGGLNYLSRATILSESIFYDPE